MPADPRPLGRLVDSDAIARFKLEHLGEPCFLCEQRRGTDAHHVVFRSQGGDDAAENLLWLLCRHCHDDIHSGRASRYVTAEG